mmetsp:Transcript_28127/g.66813  ORF Transcript_28127/g.66813 Transcript_28127/m.66813 type:complete len:304 (-) Transcript_28127:1006-1917(-)
MALPLLHGLVALVASEPSPESAVSAGALPCRQAKAAGRIAVDHCITDRIKEMHEGNCHDCTNDCCTNDHRLFVWDIMITDRTAVAAEGCAEKPTDSGSRSRGYPNTDEGEHGRQALNCHQLAGIPAYDLHCMLCTLAICGGVHDNVAICHAGDILHELLCAGQTTNKAFGHAFGNRVARILGGMHQQGSEDSGHTEECAQEGSIKERAQMVAKAIDETPKHVVGCEMGPEACLVAFHSEKPDLSGKHHDKLRDGVEKLHDPDEDHKVVDQGDGHHGIPGVDRLTLAEIHLTRKVSGHVQHKET